MTSTSIAGILTSSVIFLGCLHSVAAQDPASIPPATTGIKAFSAELTGAAEVPGPGADGSGRAFVVVSPNAGRVCYALELAGITPPTAAHIHEGEEGASGGPVVPLDLAQQGYSGCITDVDAELAERIAANPAGFYVNVHNEDFPQGALRGQLLD